jgi:hypothetical protein
METFCRASSGLHRLVVYIDYRQRGAHRVGEVFSVVGRILYLSRPQPVLRGTHALGSFLGAVTRFLEDGVLIR